MDRATGASGPDATEPFAVHVTNDGALPPRSPGERLRVRFHARDAIALRAAGPG